MLLHKIDTLFSVLPAGGRLAGLDVGGRTIGVAISDPLRRVATPVTTLRVRRPRDGLAQLGDILADRNAAGCILGFPLLMSGEEGSRCQAVRAFARALGMRFPDLLLAFWDERLSTAGVGRAMIGELDMSRARRARLVDSCAAAWILQGCLDRLRHGGHDAAP